jgi:hypothetical protein
MSGGPPPSSYRGGRLARGWGDLSAIQNLNDCKSERSEVNEVR